MGMEAVYKLSVVMGMIDDLTPKMPGVESSVSGAVKNINNGFGVLQKAGAAMAGVGTAILGTAAKLVTSTWDTQDALGELASLGVENLEAVEKAAKSFSDQWAGTSKSDFITASYDIKSGIASLTDEGVAQFTELAALTGKATKSTTEEMGSLFATGYGIYKSSYDDLSDLEFGEMFSAGIATAVKNYKTAGSEMASSISALGATATNNNVPLEEQLAILGQLQTTMSGSEAATKYKSFLNQAASAGQKLGLTFTDANNNLLSTPEILQQLKGKYGDTIDAVEKTKLKEAFGTDEAVAMIDLLYGDIDGLSSGIDSMAESMKSGTAVTKEMADAIQNTPAQKFEVMKQQIHNNAEALGSALLPSVNNLLDKVNSLISTGSEWISNNKDTVDSIVQIAAKAGVFLVVAGLLLAVIGSVGKVMMSAGTAIGTVRRAFSLLSTSFLASPVTLVIVGLVALIAVFQRLYSSSESFRNIWDNISAYLPQVIQMGLQVITNLIQSLIAALPNVISTGTQILISLIQGIASALPSIIMTGAQLLIMLIQGIGQNLPNMLMSGVQILLALLEGLISAVPSLIAGVGNVFMALIDVIMSTDWLQVGIDILTAIIEGIVGLIGKLGSAIIDGIKALVTGGESESAGAEVADKVAAGIDSGAPKVQESAGNAMDSALSMFTGSDGAGAESGGLSLTNMFGQGLQNGGGLAAQAAGGVADNAISQLTGMDTAAAQSTGFDLANNLGMGLQNGSSNMESLGIGLGTSLSSGVAEGTAGSAEAAAEVTVAWTEAESQLEGIWSRLPEKFKSAYDTIKNIASSYTVSTVAAIKAGFENMQINIPRPKLPRINVSYSTVGSGEATAKVPSYSVSYYAKGAILTGATAFGIEPGTGNTMVGGEAGPEAILPLAELWKHLKEFIGDVFEDEEREEQMQGRQLLRQETDKITRTKVVPGSSRTAGTQKASKSIRIGKLIINVDQDKIKDADALYKLIAELKDLVTAEEEEDDLVTE